MDQQPQQPPVPVPPAVAPAPQQPASQTDNPGQTLGIVGIVLGFVGLSVVGIVLSAISVSKSGKANASKTLGIVGLVLNIVITILVPLLVFPLLLTVSYSGIQGKAKDGVAKASANVVVLKAENYSEATGSYPATVAEFGTSPESNLGSTQVSENDPTDEKTVKYQRCSEKGAQVTFYMTSTKQLQVVPLGNASSRPNCG